VPFSKAVQCPDEYSTVLPHGVGLKYKIVDMKDLALLSLMSGCAFLWLLPSSRNCFLMYDLFVLLYLVRVVGPSRPDDR